MKTPIATPRNEARGTASDDPRVDAQGDPRAANQQTPPLEAGDSEHQRVTPDPGQPRGSGYAEPTREETSAQTQPVPDAAGNQAAQVAGELPGEEDEEEGEDEPTPPGEHKREPIKDPDPADTRMHVQQGSR